VIVPVFKTGGWQAILSPMGSTPIRFRHLFSGYARCRCAKWLRYSRHGKQFRQPANTRSFGTAEEKARELERRLNSGEAVVPAKPDQPKKATVADKTHILAKQSEGLSNSTRRKLKYQLGLFEQYLTDRSKFFPHEITTDDCIQFRASWKWSYKKGFVSRVECSEDRRVYAGRKM
jgi:hypothetical protein